MAQSLKRLIHLNSYKNGWVGWGALVIPFMGRGEADMGSSLEVSRPASLTLSVTLQASERLCFKQKMEDI